LENVKILGNHYIDGIRLIIESRCPQKTDPKELKVDLWLKELLQAMNAILLFG
jgi:hypothetical protein